MKKHITIALFTAVLASVYHAGCTENKNDTSSITTMRATPFDGVQGGCMNGGVKIEVLADGSVDDTQTQYICNGAQGQGGSSTNIQTTTFEGLQGNCSNGGIKVETLTDGVVQEDKTQYICNGTKGENGQDGQDGQDGSSVLVSTSNEVGENCANGGIRVDTGLDVNNNGKLETGEINNSRYICNGQNGANGQNGQDGATPTITTASFNGAQGTCENGGIEIQITLNGMMSKQYICNGADGQNGQDGHNGTNGTNASISTSTLAVGSTECPAGGVKLDIYRDKTLVSTQNICNGQNGQNGTDGTNGTNASVDSESFDGELNGCTNGGIKLTIHNYGQPVQVQIVCNGTDDSCDLECNSNQYCAKFIGCIDKKFYNEMCTTDIECLSGACRSSGLCSCEGGTYGDYGELCLLGNFASFGNYYQTDNVTKEPIKWRVLDNDTENRRVFLLSEYVLDAQAYHSSNASITWENCSLRTWLNSTFLNNAFSASEKAMILTTHLKNPKNLITDISGGNDTDDKIFLLGLSDVYGEYEYYCNGHWYFNDNADRVAYATKYTVVNRSFAYAYLDGGSTQCTSSNYEMSRCSAIWWLRSPGYNTNNAADVLRDGSVHSLYVTYVLGVRPALWVQY